MSFRRRLTLLAAGAVALAIALAAVATYFLVRDQLRNQVDETLQERAREASTLVEGGALRDGRRLLRDLRRSGAQLDFTQPDLGLSELGILGFGEPGAEELAPGESPGQGFGPGSDGRPGPRDGFGLGGPFGRLQVFGQLADSSGDVLALDDSFALLPVTSTTREIAAGQQPEAFSDATVDGVPVRILTIPGPPGTALQLARSLAEVDDTLEQLILILIFVVLGGAALAALLGFLVTRTALAPAARMTAAAEDVARTQDLGRRIEVTGEDELGRLAASFNQMLAALERSVGAQRSLVADASHELRTPLTSLRTNIETLHRVDELPDGERTRLLKDVSSELEELSRLVDDVVELAREGSDQGEGFEDVRLDQLVEAAVRRAQRRSREVEFTVSVEPSVVDGAPERLDRAVSNLLDNAVKWSSDGGPVEVTVRDATVTVRDHGPGIAEEDLPRIFDRFYRAAAARGMPGSGLGLAIAKQVVELHGGTVSATNASGGGAALELRFPA
jgi:two-component system sensor histidine kinase MprB